MGWLVLWHKVATGAREYSVSSFQCSVDLPLVKSLEMFAKLSFACQDILKLPKMRDARVKGRNTRGAVRSATRPRAGGSRIREPMAAGIPSTCQAPRLRFTGPPQ